MPTQTTETLLRQIRAQISRQVNIPEQHVSLDSTFRGDLGFDSLEEVEFIMAVEEQFRIEIPDETASEIRTVKQAVDKIEQAIAQNSRQEQAGSM